MSRNHLYWYLFLPCLVHSQGDLVPAYVLQMPASVETVLIAEADVATLHRYENSEKGLRSVHTQRISIGQNGVAKQKTGDRRTPLGIYFILEELDTSNLHEKYGPVAFPLDYPNAWDQRNDRSGHGIWIHGVTPNSGPRPDRDTDGCISLSNEELMLLERFITPTQTPVIVTRILQHRSRTEIGAMRDSLLDALDSWVRSYRDGDWHRFLSLYSEDFEYRDMNAQEWSEFRIRTIANRPVLNFSADDVMLLADPEEAGLYLSRFRQTITEADRQVVTTKRLYWRRNSAGDLRIVAEDNG
jgi:murein L,D-transpeptidase YafK